MNIVANIKAIRERSRVRQEDVAEKLQMARANYAYLELRGDKLTIEQLEKIAGALGVGLLELFTGEQRSETVIFQAENASLKKRIAELERWLQDKEMLVEMLRNN